MKSRWVHHNGRRILIADFSQFGGDAAGLQAEVNAIKEIFKLELPQSVSAITYVEGTFANPEILQVFAGLLPYTNKYVRKRALVGVAGFRKHFIETLASLMGEVQFKPFDTLDQALDWIAEE
jgi:hypothetical protein